MLDDGRTMDRLRAGVRRGTPVVVRADTQEKVLAALARPEVAAVLVPPEKRELMEIDLVERRMARGPIVATYSIVACDLEAGQWGVAVQSKFLSVGSVVPGPSRGSGRSRRRRTRTRGTGPNGLALLREGQSAQEAVDG